MIARSKLFVPASRPQLFEKAMASDADVICFDLEDSVLPVQKAEARENLRQLFSNGVRGRQEWMVRVNHADSEHFKEDLAAVTGSQITAIALPKVEDVTEIEKAADTLLVLEKQRDTVAPIAILATIESARGLRLAEKIAKADTRVIGLQLGLADLFEPLGIRQSDRATIHHVRLCLRLAAGEAGISCFDSAFADFHDRDGFVDEARCARDLGFSGKSCIHPRQIADANRIFSPDEREIVWAQRVVDAAASAANGAFTVDGRMIDAPFIKRAEATLAMADAIRQRDAAREDNG